VSLGDAVRQALPELRAEARSLMYDRVRITRGGGDEPVLDPDTLIYAPAGRDVVYVGPGLIDATAAAAVIVFGQTDVSVARAVLKLPWDAPELEIDDQVVVERSEHDLNEANVYRVVVAPASTATVRRMVGIELVEEPAP
jgi:hypothetical protein